MKRSLVMLTSLLAACTTQGVQPDVPALLASPDKATLQQIEQTVTGAVGGAKVTLAADVLTVSSVLVIERGMRRGIDRPPELGRDLGRPYRFQLVLSGAECVLVDEQTGQRFPLPGVECVKE